MKSELPGTYREVLSRGRPLRGGDIAAEETGETASDRRTLALGGNHSWQTAASWKSTKVRAAAERPLLPKPFPKLPRMSRSRVTLAPDLVLARSGQTRK